MLPYPYRTRPALARVYRAWSAAEAVWTRREQYKPRVISESPEPTRTQKRSLGAQIRTLQRRMQRAARRAFVAVNGPNTIASVKLPRTPHTKRSQRHYRAALQAAA